MLEEGKKPKDYGLKVRSHPGNLMVTGYGKKRWGHKVRYNFTSRLLQTRAILTDEKNSLFNYQCVKKIIDNNQFKLNQSETAYICDKVKSDDILDFVGNYQIKGSALWQPAVIKEFIKKRVIDNELINWHVAILNSQDRTWYKTMGLKEKPRRRIEGLDENLFLTMRNGVIGEKSVNISKSYVSPYHEWLDFDEEKVKKIESIKNKEMKANYAREFRSKENGLLLLYPLYGFQVGDNLDGSYGLEYEHPIFAPAISFSGMGEDKEYVLDGLMVRQLELELDL